MLVLPGIVLVTRGGGRASFMIRLGAAFRDKPNLGNHVAVAHHTDKDGTPWGLEGRPGGVGWVDLRKYIDSPWTVTNAEQPIDPRVRSTIAKKMEAMIGTEYDWNAIAADAFESLHIRALFKQNWKGQGAPGHVVCSSFAAYLYHAADLPAPLGDARYVTPGDWGQFIVVRGWGK